MKTREIAEEFYFPYNVQLYFFSSECYYILYNNKSTSFKYLFQQRNIKNQYIKLTNINKSTAHKSELAVTKSVMWIALNRLLFFQLKRLIMLCVCLKEKINQPKK